MPTLPSLLKKFQQLTREQSDLEVQIAEVHRQILDAGTTTPRAKRPRASREEIVEVVQATVKVLRDAGQPLPRREIAARLGITPWATAYRLQKAIKIGFVRKTHYGRYECADATAAALK